MVAEGSGRLHEVRHLFCTDGSDGFRPIRRGRGEIRMRRWVGREGGAAAEEKKVPKIPLTRCSLSTLANPQFAGVDVIPHGRRQPQYTNHLEITSFQHLGIGFGRYP